MTIHKPNLSNTKTFDTDIQSDDHQSPKFLKQPSKKTELFEYSSPIEQPSVLTDQNQKNIFVKQEMPSFSWNPQRDKEKVPGWLDCDPGIDDALAILLIAANQDKLNLLGISTLTGNGLIERVSRNAAALCEDFHMEHVPVYKGSPAPLVRKPLTATDVHGISGLRNYMPEPSKQPEAENGLLAMRNALIDAKDPVVVFATGPLTNLALLFKTFPEVKEKIRHLYMMGGSSVGGNTNKEAEFNIQADPEAAAIVFDQDVDMTICPLDVTLRSLILHEDIQQFPRQEGRIYEICRLMLEFYAKSPSNIGRAGVPIHDAVTVACFLHPEFFTPKKAVIEVDTSMDPDRHGKTTFHFISESDSANFTNHPVHDVLQDVDELSFRKLMLDAINKLNQES